MCILFAEQSNKRDRILNRISDPEQKLSIIREFEPAEDKILRATWDIVIGLTPEDPETRRRPGGPPTRTKG